MNYISSMMGWSVLAREYYHLNQNKNKKQNNTNQTLNRVSTIPRNSQRKSLFYADI